MAAHPVPRHQLVPARGWPGVLDTLDDIGHVGFGIDSQLRLPTVVAHSFCPCRGRAKVHYPWHPYFGRKVSVRRPQVDIGPLSDLKRLLTPATASPSSQRDGGIAREKVDGKARRAALTSCRQMSLMFESRRMDGMSDAERTKAVITLAQILMQATRLVVEELGDDRR